MSVERSLFSVFLVSILLASAVIAQSASEQQALTLPPPVGATRDEADIVFWFLASEVEQFSDATWAEHKQLLELMEANSIRARVEHYFLSKFDELWRVAKKEEQLPNFLVARSLEPFRGLMADGVLRDVVSTRLRYPDATSSCSDFRVASRIWQVLEAPSPELAERAITALLEPRRDALLGPLAELSNVQRVLLATKAKTVAQAWFKYDFVELEKHWHERAPQRLTSKSIDKDVEKSEREYRNSTQFRKVQLYGNSNLVIAIFDAVTKVESKEQVGALVSRSSINQSPVCVMLAKVNDDYRVLLVGTWQFEFKVDDSTAAYLFTFTETQSQVAGEELGKLEILEPADGAVFGDDEFKVRWKSSSKASQKETQSDNFFFIQRHRDGNFTVERLEASKEFESCVRGDSELAIWNIRSDGQVEFSDAVHLGYDPSLTKF